MPVYRFEGDAAFSELLPGEAPVCDFCSTRPAAHTFPCHSFTMTVRDPFTGALVDHRSQDAWEACRACATLIENGKIRALVRRSLRALARETADLSSAEREHLLATVERWHHQFFEYRISPEEGE